MKALYSIARRLAWSVSTLVVVPFLAAGPTDLPSGLVAKQRSLLESMPLIAAGNLEQAEQILHRANLQKPGSPDWESEAGTNLLELASALDNQNQRKLAATAVRRALVHFGQAETGFGAAANPGQMAHQRELMGFVYEHYLGDRKSAEACYASALALAPASDFAAKHLALLKQVDAQEAIKLNALTGR